MKHNTDKIEPFDFKKGQKQVFYSPRSLKITWSGCVGTYWKIRSVRIFEKVSNEYSHMTRIRLIYQLFHTNRSSLTFRDVASFSTSCRPGSLSFPHILKIARMTSTHWPHQHFELLCFFSSPQQRIIYYKRVEWSNQKFVGPDLHVYGLATPLTFTAEQEIESKKERKRKKGSRGKKKQWLNLFSGLDDWAARTRWILP